MRSGKLRQRRIRARPWALRQASVFEGPIGLLLNETRKLLVEKFENVAVRKDIYLQPGEFGLCLDQPQNKLRVPIALRHQNDKENHWGERMPYGTGPAS